MKYGILLLLLATVGACTQGKSTMPAPTFSDNMGLSVSPISAGQVNTGILGKTSSLAYPTALRLSHRTLGKPLLYMMGTIRSTDPKKSYYTATYPRIIQFSLNQRTLVMEDLLVRIPFDHASQAIHKTIAHFPVISDDGQTIEFDFANGTKYLNAWLLLRNTENIIPNIFSYITSSQASSNTLTLDQTIQITNGDGDNHSWVVRHVFSASLAHSSLEPRKPDETHNVGYFTIPSWFTAGSTENHNYITRWSLDRPIRFALSTNTPSAYREGIIQGVLDWNATFGKEVFKLVDTPANFSPLDLDVELGIHWAEDDTKGLAYGTFLPHPQTGEVLHADIVIYSGWGKAYKDNYQNPTFQPNQTTHDDFSSATICTMDNSDMQSEIDATPALQNREIFKSYVTRAFRTLTRHEVGHTLGLRHNFMGSLGAEAEDSVFDLAFQNFLAGKEDEKVSTPSSSIMDYIPLSQGIFMPPVSPYDKAAITWGYFSPIGSIPKNTPLFCTDDDTQGFGSADCTPYDAGSEPLTYIPKSLDRDISTYLHNLIQLTTYPQSQLDEVPPTSLPSLGKIGYWVNILRRYSNGQVSVLSLNGKHGLERRALAKTILNHFASSQNWNVPELFTIIANLEHMAINAEHDDKYWARDVLTRLALGIKKLKSALDAQPTVDKNSGNGTTANSNYGD